MYSVSANPIHACSQALLAHAWERARTRVQEGPRLLMPSPLHPRAAAGLGTLAPGSRGWVGTKGRTRKQERIGETAQTDPRPLQMELLYVCMCLHARVIPGILGMGVSLRLCVTPGSLQAISFVAHLQGCG